jgi:hypothetical protein
MFLPLLFSILSALPQGDSTLRNDIAEVRALIAAEDGVAAKQRIETLLSKHEGSEELIRHFPSVQESMLESLYLIDIAEREAAQKAKGGEVPEIPFNAKIVSYKKKTGEFKLRWEGKEQLEDFELDEDGLIFPLDLSGKFRIGFEISEYPSTGQVEIDIINIEGRCFEIDCGMDGGGINGSVARVGRVTEAGNKMLQRGEKKLPQPGKPTMIAMKAVGASLQVLNGRSKILAFKLPRGEELGQVVISGLDPATLVAVEYDGPIDAVSLASRLAAKKARERVAFRQSIDLTEHMPEWLFPYLQATVFGLDGVKPPGPDFKNAEEEKAWEWALKRIDQARVRYYPNEVLSMIQDLSPEALTKVLKEYASMRVAYEGGHWFYAAGHAENVLALDPNHEPTKQLQLEILARKGSGELTWEYAIEQFKEDPTNPAPVMEAMRLLMQIDMVDDLKYFLDDSKDLPDTLKNRCLEMLKRREAPAGNGMKTLKLSKLEITSNLSSEKADEVAAWLAAEVPKDTLRKDDKLRLFLFRDRWDYDEFTAEVIGQAHPSAAGFFSPEYDAVIAWHNPDQEAFELSVRREMMIHIGKRIHPSYPVWACIGLSELVLDGSMAPNVVAERFSERASDLYRAAKADGIIPFGNMLRMSGPTYYALEIDRTMEAQAWLMCMMLMVAGEEAEVNVMDQLIEGPRSGMTWAETADSVTFAFGSGSALNSAYSWMIRIFQQYLTK